MMANMGLNRFAPQASDRGAPGANGNGDEYMRLEELHDSDDAAYSPVFSPPRYPGYAPLPDGGEVPLSAVTAESASDDHFSPVPSMISRRRERPRYDEEDGMKIGARALASPPPHERAAHSHSRHAHAPTEESHDSVFSESSGATGATGLMDTRPQLSSSTSTIVTAVTAVTTPPMGTDDMLMTLLAGQALVDCRELSSATATWEDIDLWKKELRLLSARVEDAQTRYQREERILTAARSLQKLNQTNKRLSRQTIASMEDAEKRVERARKVRYSYTGSSLLLTPLRTCSSSEIAKPTSGGNCTSTGRAHWSGRCSAWSAHTPRRSRACRWTCKQPSRTGTTSSTRLPPWTGASRFRQR
jgi:hypothetical protein